MYDRPLDDLGPDPEHLEWTANDPVDVSEKMATATQVAGELLALTMPALGFDRDQLAPNYQYKPEDFYRLLAHIALEDCYAANGAKLLRWQTDDDVAVPPPATLRSYAREYEVSVFKLIECPANRCF